MLHFKRYESLKLDSLGWLSLWKLAQKLDVWIPIKHVSCQPHSGKSEKNFDTQQYFKISKYVLGKIPNAGGPFQSKV